MLAILSHAVRVSQCAVNGGRAVRAKRRNFIDAAKKEGKVVIYGSLESDTMDAIVQGFKKKTGIEAEYWRASATKVMDRAMTEFRAGKPAADAIVAADNVMRLMQQGRLLSKVRFADQ